MVNELIYEALDPDVAEYMKKNKPKPFHGQNFSCKYLLAYAAEVAWREDNRRAANGAKHEAATGAALSHLVSRVRKGNWQR